MVNVDHYNLRSFDLNLFLAFDAMMLERNVTRAARRLRVQQPAMSHSLSVLRMLFQDELFVRAGQKMEPTPYALQLSAPIRRILVQSQEALAYRAKFDPGSETRTFRIALCDQFEALLMPDLLRDLKEWAPGIVLSIVEATRKNVFEMLDDGRVEIATGCFEPRFSWVAADKLYDEEHVCCFNEELVSIDTPINLDQYLRHPHVLVSLKDNPLGYLEQAFSAAGRTPNVVLSAPHFFSVAAIASRAPVIATLPKLMAARYADAFNLSSCAVPIPLQLFPVSTIWHSRLERDEGVRWLRQRIGAIARGLVVQTGRQGIARQ